MEMEENLNEKEPKIYELGYLLSPLVAEDVLADTVNTVLRQPIEATGARIVSETHPAMRPLAYKVAKEFAGKTNRYSDAYFGAIRFTARPSAIAKIKEVMDRSELVLRFMTIIAPKDNPPRAPRRPMAVKTDAPVEEGGTPKVAAPMTTEDIDKEIEDLLVTA